MKSGLLIAGAVLNLFSVVPYLRDILRKSTKPNVVSWLTWTMLTGIGTAAVIVSEGFGPALLPLSATLATLSVVLLGAKYGFAKYSKFDGVCQSLAVLGLVFWFVFNSPTVALISVVVIDFVAVLPTLRHSWLHPEEETWQTFAIATLAALLTLLGIGSYTFNSTLYPVYLFIANGLVAATILLRGRTRPV